MVRLGGLEPPTKSLGNSCSVHLSYSRRPAHYNLSAPASFPLSPGTGERAGERGNGINWLQLAFSGPVRRRALRIMVVVGVILITINHGDAILQGAVDGARLARILLTLAVPFIVAPIARLSPSIDGGQGNDLLSGGLDNDRITGGPGRNAAVVLLQDLGTSIEEVVSDAGRPRAGRH